jgi:hypothetical protein
VKESPTEEYAFFSATSQMLIPLSEELHATSVKYQDRLKTATQDSSSMHGLTNLERLEPPNSPATTTLPEPSRIYH